MLLHIFIQVAHGHDGLDVLTVHLLHPEFLLQRHGQIHQIHGIRAQIIHKSGVSGDGLGVYTELLGDQLTQFFEHFEQLLYVALINIIIGAFRPTVNSIFDNFFVVLFTASVSGSRMGGKAHILHVFRDVLHNAGSAELHRLADGVLHGVAVGGAVGLDDRLGNAQ